MMIMEKLDESVILSEEQYNNQKRRKEKEREKREKRKEEKTNHSSHLENPLRNRLHIRRLERDPMTAIPLHDLDPWRIAKIPQEVAMELEARIPQPVHVQRREGVQSILHRYRTVVLVPVLRQVREAEVEATAFAAGRELTESKRRRPTRHQDTEFPPRAREAHLRRRRRTTTNTTIKTKILPLSLAFPQLPLHQHAKRQLSPLTKPNQTHPLARPRIRLHSTFKHKFNLGYSLRLIVHGGVGGKPAGPAVAGAHGRVDGLEVVVHVAEEGPVGEDEAEVRGEGREEGAELEAEDVGADAAAVEAEDAGFGEGHFCFCFFFWFDFFIL